MSDSKQHSESYADERGDDVGWALDHVEDGAVQAILAGTITNLEEQLQSAQNDYEEMYAENLRGAEAYVELKEQYEVQRDKLITLDAEYDRLKEQLEAVVDLMRFRPEMDCWCAFRSMEEDNLHTDACLGVREILGVSSPASESKA